MSLDERGQDFMDKRRSSLSHKALPIRTMALVPIIIAHLEWGTTCVTTPAMTVDIN